MIAATAESTLAHLVLVPCTCTCQILLAGTIVDTVRPARDTWEAMFGLQQHIGTCIRCHQWRLSTSRCENSLLF